VVSIHIKEQGEGPLRDRFTTKWGTGVLIAPNLVLTNNHVLSSQKELGRTLIYADHVNIRANEPYTPLTPIHPKGEKSRLFFTNADLDFTIFEVVPDGRRPVAIGYSEKSEYSLTGGTTIISNPLGQGIIYSNSNRPFSIEGNKIYHFSNSYPGSSGSPIFDKEGALIGIHRQSYYNTSTNIADRNEGVFYGAIVKALSSRTSKAHNQMSKTLGRSLEAAEVEFGIESVLLGLPPGHERLTASAIHESNVEMLANKRMTSAIITGNIDVDYPTYWGLLPKLSDLYRSHYGGYAYRHSMLTDEIYEGSKDDNERLKKVVSQIFKYLDSQIAKFIDFDRIDRHQAARELGRLIHTIQDSYSKAHVERDEKGAMKAALFYNATDHDKAQHKKADLVLDDKGEYKPEAITAIAQTARILRAAYNNSQDRDSTRLELLKIIKEVFEVDELTSATRPPSPNPPQSFIRSQANLESASYSILLPEITQYRAHSKHAPIERPVNCCPPIDIEGFQLQ
jgi:V8-like Glu-specific endopeptidase